MKKIISLSILLCFYCFGLSLSFSQVVTDVDIGKRYSMHSAILKEERPYWVYLPPSYNNTLYALKTYPVLILLDGDFHFHSVTGTVQFLSANKCIPEMIVVGIPNTDRTRDLTPTHSDIAAEGNKVDFFKSSGGGDTFLRFLEEELLPKIDSTYRTVSCRLLVGHSFGGLLAVHSFMKEKKTFDAYIAIDPSAWFDDQYLVRKAKEGVSNVKDRRLYISSANNSNLAADTTKFRTSVEQLFSVLSSKCPSSTSLKLDYFEEEDHGSVPLISLYYGLLFSFKGYPLKNIYDKDLGTIVKHYTGLSETLGYKVLPDEELINRLGYNHLLYTKKNDEAMEFFLYNVELYPNSSNAYDSLGEGYKTQGNKKKAIECYKKALELNPSNLSSRKKLKELEK